MKFALKIIIYYVQLALIFGDVPFDYCSLNGTVCEGKPHVVCCTLESTLGKEMYALVVERVNITIVKLSDSEKSAVINFINAQRNKIALGQTLLPSGSNLQKTVWDDELELFAKSFVQIQALVIDEDLCFKRRNGKIVYSHIFPQDNPKTIKDAVRDILKNAEDTDNDDYNDFLTELAFASKMGCYFGYAADQNDSNLHQGGITCVLDYGMEREAARESYAEGVPCSGCKNDLGCDSTFAGLCATDFGK